MKKLTSAQVRQLFLDFFKEKGHRQEPSSSLVPHDDPSLLWINSGVATLKKYFDGRVIPDNPRIVNAQKAIRTNDIENVGFTARHHTFFEMLGNFSIGDYFKEEAIQWAWEFLTSEKWIGFEPERLTVTVHPEDDEAYDIWLNTIKLPKTSIIRLEENFWDIGEGPSGPQTEIFYDRGEAYGNDPSDPELYPGGENERYLEIWNLVFSQFNHNPDGTYTLLPNNNIDTGLGLERMVSVIQETPTNFETDLFSPIIREIEKFTKVKYYDGNATDTAFKVIADHIRTVTFAIGDGALPSNEGRGYVLRRLIRRAIRFAKELRIEKPFMYQLVQSVADIMKDFYPEIDKQHELIERMIKVEEERFHMTLNEGLEILSTIMVREKEKGLTVFPGQDVFLLYDTYGFPKELTEEYVTEQGFTIDEQGFNEEMSKQQERARRARQDDDSMQVQNDIFTKIDVKSQFIGYEHVQTETEVVQMIQNNRFVTEVERGEEALVVLAETPFYAESGGQVADTGWIHAEELMAEVEGVQKSPKGLHIHQVHVTDGTLVVGQMIQAEVNQSLRKQIIKNHTATHLLHQALKDVLGSHVNQAGSLVQPERLRFDFSHFAALEEEELHDIEQIVNQKIWDSLLVTITEKPLEEAKTMGAMALFGEKYSDMVRVVQIGDYSIELCGGCHVTDTSELGLFKIVNETGIGAGTRRIEAVTSQFAFSYLNDKETVLERSASLLKTTIENVPVKIAEVNQSLKQMQKEMESLQAKLTHAEATDILESIQKIGQVTILTQKVKVRDMNQLRTMLDDVKQQLPSGVILLATENNGKVQLAAGVSKDLVEQGLHAGHLIKEAASICGGGGGGRPDMAQAGGKDPAKIEEALQYAVEYVSQKQS